jgi:hypothetical protein
VNSVGVEYIVSLEVIYDSIWIKEI